MHHRIDPPRPMLRPDATNPATPRTLLHRHRHTPSVMPTVHADPEHLAAETSIHRDRMMQRMTSHETSIIVR
jgi:hypothetical protein